MRAGILYAKYKTEKLMEHLKLFATRLNIPRLIRVCEDLHHWKELVFLYIQYDEYDNAALVQVRCPGVAGLAGEGSAVTVGAQRGHLQLCTDH